MASKMWTRSGGVAAARPRATTTTSRRAGSAQHLVRRLQHLELLRVAAAVRVPVLAIQRRLLVRLPDLVGGRVRLNAEHVVESKVARVGGAVVVSFRIAHAAKARAAETRREAAAATKHRSAVRTASGRRELH